MITPSTEWLRALFALIFVVGLIWLIGYAMRRYGWKLGMPVAPLNKAERRLKIVESLNLDAKNRLLLIKRDNTEHLVILNNDTASVIETSIPSGPQG